MAQQSDEQFLQEHYQWFQKSDHWHDKALSLRAMANALYSKALPGLRRYEKARKAAQKELRDRSVVPIKAVEPDILPAIALYGAALENALKGLMVSQEPTLIGARKLSPKLRSHKLVELERAAGISLSSDEQYLLKWVSEVVIWKGRYPVPTNTERATHLFHPLDNVTLESTRSKFRELGTVFARIDKAIPRRRMRLKFGVLVRLDD
jgi:hypothetical protein